MLFFLKTSSLFLLILLLINPKIKTTELESLKPVLSVLADNSNSILFFNEDKNITSFLKKIKEDKSINEKFDIQEYSFGSKLNNLDTVDKFFQRHKLSKFIQKNKLTSPYLFKK